MLVGRCSKMRVISAVRVALERGLGFLLLTFFLGRLRASLFLLYKILESVQFDQRHVFQVQLEALRHVALADQSAQLQQICVLQILYPGSQFSFLCDGYEAFGLALGLLRQGGKWAGLRSGLGDSPLDRFGLGAANHNGFEFQLFVISFKILGDLEEVCVGSVEEVAVFEDELDIRVELSNREIFALVQVNSNRLQIHRIFYQLCVVRDPHGYRVHRLQKRPRVLILPQLKQDFLRPSDHLVVAEGVQGLRMRSSHAHLRYIFLFLLGNHAGVFGEPVALFTRCGFAVFSSAIYLQGVVGGEQSGDGGRLRYGQGETERLARTVLCEEALRWVLAVLPEGLGAQILIHALQILYTVWAQHALILKFYSFLAFLCWQSIQYIYISIIMSQQITASRMNMQVFKQKIAAAKKGHELLKRKADALKKKFKEVMKELLDSKTKMGKECKEAYFLIAEAKYAAGDFQGKVLEAVRRSTIRLDKSEDNIAGVLIPSLTVREFQDTDNAMSQIGLERGGHSIQICRQKFRSILSLMVDIASLQASFLTLDEKIKVTNRRVNALEHVVIPRFIVIYKYIEQELDEQAREDFFRLKKVLDNKKKHGEEEESIKAKDSGQNVEHEASQNLLDDVDEDLIF